MRLNKLLVAFRSKSRKNDRLLGLILPRIEQLEERCTPAGVSLIQNVALPGANTAWDFSKAPFIASPVVYDLDGDGQDEVIVTGGDGNLYAYKENTSTGNLVQEKEYFTGPFGQVNGAPVPIQSTPIVVNLPSGLAVFAANAQGWVFGWNAVTGFIIPGWPQNVKVSGETTNPGDPTPDGVFGSIAAGDLENDGNPDIVVPSFNHEVTAFHSNGSVFWRFNNDDTVFSGIAIGDINRSGRLSVIVGGDSSPSFAYWAGGRINALSWNGQREWVVQTNQVIWSTPTLADLQGNGDLDVIVGTGVFYGPNNNTQFNLPQFPGNEVYAVDPNGNILPGWPFITASNTTEGRVQTSIAVGDLLGNGQLDVVFADFAGNLYAVNPSGQQIWKTAAYPGIQLYGSPIIGPGVNGDTNPDVFIGSPGADSDGVDLAAFDGANGDGVFAYPGAGANPNINPTFPEYNAPAIGNFAGGSSYQMVVVANNNSTNGALLSPSDLEFFSLGTTSGSAPWNELRPGGAGTAVARSAGFSTNLIDDLYNGALHRSPSQAEVNGWLPQFETAPSLQPLIAAIVTSTEARTYEITGWYEKYLNRGTDSAGLQSWINFIASGQTWAAVQANILASQEAFGDGGNTNSGWVTYLYMKVLGRSPSASELAGWVNPLNAGTITRPQVAIGFFLSPEFTDDDVTTFYATYVPNGITSPTSDDFEAMGMDLRSGHTEENVLVQMLTANGDYVATQVQGSWVRAIYQDVLGRAPAPQEVSNWLGAIEGGASLNTVATVIIGSAEGNAELLSTAQFPAGSAVRLGQIQGYYQKFLERTPSASEEQNWVNQLDAGVSRDQVITAFITSPEYYSLAGSTVQGYIDKVFNDLLGHAPNSTQLQQEESDPNVIQDLPKLVLQGAPNEYNQDLVTGWFVAYLGRFTNNPSDGSRLIAEGTAYGAQGLVDQLNGGANPITIQAAILASVEFQDDALYKDLWGGGGRWLG